MTLKSQAWRSFNQPFFYLWVTINSAGLFIAELVGGTAAGIFLILLITLFDRSLDSLGIFAVLFFGIFFGIYLGAPILLLPLATGISVFGETFGPAIIGCLILAVAGAVIGGMQWFFLRPHLPHSRGWVLATIIGWAAAGLVAGRVAQLSFIMPMANVQQHPAMANQIMELIPGWPVSFFLRFTLVGLAAGAIGGGVSGLIQGLLLRRNFAQARWWVMSLGGWALGGAIAATVPTGAGVMLGGAIAGVITGIPLTRLLPHPPPEL